MRKRTIRNLNTKGLRNTVFFKSRKFYLNTLMIVIVSCALSYSSSLFQTCVLCQAVIFLTDVLVVLLNPNLDVHFVNVQVGGISFVMSRTYIRGKAYSEMPSNSNFIAYS